MRHFTVPCVLRTHNFAVVGDLLVSNTQVRHLLTGQLLRTFAPGRLFVNTMPVPGQPHLLVTGERRGHVHLWDIETGECMCMRVEYNMFRRARAPIDSTTSASHSKPHGCDGNTTGVRTWLP